ncbi:MAG: glycosyltransferase [Isosphaeraceae bacterium]
MTSMPTDRSQKIRIVHVINSLANGGAEAMLANLAVRTDRGRFEPSVALLIDDRTQAAAIEAAGIPISQMGMRPGIPDPVGLGRLARHLRRVRPHVVQTWMDHSNLIGGLAARAALGSSVRVVWGVHHSNHVPGLTKRTTLWTLSACASLSRRVPDRIVLVSQAGHALYSSRGFDMSRMTVIPNGFDTQSFQPDPAARLAVRRELGIDPDVTLVGLVARYDPNKDHPNFLRAASILASRDPEVRFLLCGMGIDEGNAALTQAISSLGLSDRCHLLGRRGDVARIHAALDLEVSSSLSEAFPLVLGEAMACGVPCVATHVGDSALIVGSCGRIVPPREPHALAFAMAELLALPIDDRRRLGLAARKRIAELFDLSVIAHRYERLYEQLVQEAGTSSSLFVSSHDPKSPSQTQVSSRLI